MTQAAPGGDAADPERAALERLATARWGVRTDKDKQMRAPLLDWRHWKRVRFWGFEHFLGFRYGDDHYAVTVVTVLDEPTPAPGQEPRDSAGCMRRFEAWARPQLRGFEFELQPPVVRTAEWLGQSLVTKSADGFIDFAFQHREFSAAWAAYARYPDACIVYAVAVPWGKNAALARQVRDRFVSEGFARLRFMSETKPVRRK